MKRGNRLISLLMSLILLITSVSVSSVAFAEDDVSLEAYYAVIDQIREHMKNRETSFEITDTGIAINSAGYNRLCSGETVKRDIYFEDKQGELDAYAGDYLYHSVKTLYSERYLNGETGMVDKVVFETSYITDAAQENAVNEFADNFIRIYLSDIIADGIENMSDEQKYYAVKSIYDFIVRNTDYDFPVFRNEFDETTERYNIAHSAYGAIYGSLLAQGKEISEYKWDTKYAIHGEQVPVYTDQGLSVCEGFSKLFYVLCEKLGIPCHIVDGEYTDGREDKDPHEWIYVYLNDFNETYGAQWYQIDATHAATKGSKDNFDIVNYNYFLRGTLNPNFAASSHQQPYTAQSVNPVVEPLYDFPSIVFDYDYQFPQFDVSEENAGNMTTGVVVRRTLNLDGTYSYEELYCKDGKFYLDNETDNPEKEVEGFQYSSFYSSFDVILPYVVGSEYEYVPATDICGVADYSITVYGRDNKALTIPFSIVPYDMSSNNLYDFNLPPFNSNYIEYSGKAVNFVHGFKDEYQNSADVDNYLVEGTDYDVEYITKDGDVVNAICDVGTYNIKYVFKGNYRGEFTYEFTVRPADLERFMNNITILVPGYDASTETFHLPAYSESIITNNNITYSYFFRFNQLVTLDEGIDYVMEYSGGLSSGSTGTATLVGLEGSSKIAPGSRKTYKYIMDGKMDDYPVVQETEHNYIASVTAPTCTNGGYTTYTCSRCGAKYIESGAEALGHIYESALTAPSCTEGGFTTYTCSRCGDTYTAEETSALGHEMGEWENTTAAVQPTCTLNGVTDGEIRYCYRCNYYETRGGNTISALGHDWGEWTETEPAVEPTYTEYGKTAVETRSCSRCGEEETRGGEAVEPLRVDISFVNGLPSTMPTAYYYTGSQIKPTQFNIFNDYGMVLGRDYDIASYSNNINASNKAIVTVRGINGFTGTADIFFTINKISINNANVKKSYKYANNNLTFTATYNNKALVKGKDYTITRTDSKPNDYGIITRLFKITGINNFNGAIQYKVLIQAVPKLTSTNITKVKSSKKKTATVTWKKIPKNIKGYRVEYSLYKDFRNYKAVNVGPKKTSVTIKGLTSKKVYYFRIRAYNYNATYKRNFYSFYSSVKNIKVK